MIDSNSNFLEDTYTDQNLLLLQAIEIAREIKDCYGRCVWKSLEEYSISVNWSLAQIVVSCLECNFDIREYYFHELAFCDDAEQIYYFCNAQDKKDYDTGKIAAGEWREIGFSVQKKPLFKVTPFKVVDSLVVACENCNNAVFASSNCVRFGHNSREEDT